MAQAAHATQTSKTDTYLYRGKDRLGKPVRGEVKSESVALAKAQLRKQGIIAQDLHKKAKPLFGDRKKPIKPADIAVFSRQLATMMKAGVPLVQSFDIVADGQENAAFRQMIVDIRNDVAGGIPWLPRSPSIHATSTICSATWCMPASSRESWTQCSTG